MPFEVRQNKKYHKFGLRFSSTEDIKTHSFGYLNITALYLRIWIYISLPHEQMQQLINAKHFSTPNFILQFHIAAV